MKNQSDSATKGKPPTASPRAAADPLLSIVLPGYNEVDALEWAVDRYLEALARCGVGDFEIILVDDGSTDGTGPLADRIARKHRRVRVLHNERNVGQSASLLRGFGLARGRILTWNGVDIPFQPEDMAKVLPWFDGPVDVVVVQRSSRQAYGIVRKIISWSNVLLLRLLFASPFRDHNFVQFFRREVIESIEVRSAGVSTVTAELIIRAKRQGYRVVAVDAEYHQRTAGKSTITLGKTVHAFLETMRLWWLMQTGGRAAPRGRTQ